MVAATIAYGPIEGSRVAVGTAHRARAVGPGTMRSNSDAQSEYGAPNVTVTVAPVGSGTTSATSW